MTVRDTRYTDDYTSDMMWGKKETDKDVWEAAVERCAITMEQHDDCYVAFSGGKDSTSVLHAALEAKERLNIRQPLKVAYMDEEVTTPETDDYAARCVETLDIDMRWYCLPFQQRNACSADHPYWYPWAPEDEHLWVRNIPEYCTNTLANTPLFPTAVKDRPTVAEYGPWAIADWRPDAPKRRSLGIILGIRVDESIMRRRIIAKRGTQPHPWLVPGSGKEAWHAKSYPIYDWSVDDVWALVVQRNIDYNHTYDYLEALGQPPARQRVGPPFGEEPLHGLYVWKETHPEMWDKMTRRVPGAATAARYANTPLYGRVDRNFNGKGDNLPPPPPGGTHMDTIRASILTHTDPATRSHVARAVQAVINAHTRRTTDPILPHAPHPASGVSWRILNDLAIKGDLKNRKQMRIQPNAEKQKKLQTPYTQALQQAIADGTINECR